MMKLLVVGSGLFGSVVARERALAGDQVTVIDKRPHLAGNIYTEDVAGIPVHRYGAHIFHTNSPRVWQYVTQFAAFNRFTNQVLANYHGRLFNLPFNMNTFHQMWGVTTPEEAQAKIAAQQTAGASRRPANLEEQAIALVGRDIYQNLIKEYTAKQWGRDPVDLPAFIIRRLPVRFTYDNNYFNDRYQGIPMGGYTAIVEKMLALPTITVQLNTDFLADRGALTAAFDRIVYTGAIDGFFDYRFGTLAYRSLRFEDELLDIPNFQGSAVVNYTDRETPYTRIIEHKHFIFGGGNRRQTVITREYPAAWQPGAEPYYPVNDPANEVLFQQYRTYAAAQAPQVIFGGRLGAYRYYNMDQVIAAALQVAYNEDLWRAQKV